ncbi:ATP synthase gamma chain [bacterium BMS3Abin02]|nr:ATP synthase gamma chain [bacterium BMS3Abin02]GBE23294.1 ATP synthase gamma chain [bacterium BMS3Bbin01]HDL49007.1 F0F1 ATP synthase subunit gamma [Actinomycetota bacterium]
MASAELRQTRRRIRSVQSTKKITRAMELIAASRIVKAQQRVHASKPYVEQLTDVIRNVGRAAGGATHMLLERRDVRAAGIVVVSSDRGLAGAFNSTVIRMAERRIVELRSRDVQIRVYVVGKKAQTYFRFRGYHVERAFLGVTDAPGYADARNLANVIMEEYASRAVDAVEVFYTRYVSALVQDAVGFELLPIIPPEVDEEPVTTVTYSYEPSPSEILDRLLPRYVEASAFGVLLDSSASEHASRQRAMKAATENAEDLIKVLSRMANQARQAEITTEISEIVGGAEALRNT